MPLPVIAFCALLSLALVLRHLRQVPDWPSRLLIMFFWARFAVSAPHTITARSLGAGLSISALVTMTFAALLVATVASRDLRSRYLALYLPLCAVLLLSTLFNPGEMKGFIVEAIAWTLFVGVFLVLRRSIEVNGVDRMMLGIIYAGVTPILLQLASIATGTSIGSELDGSRGFIGGYVHESVFSRMVLIVLVAALLVNWRSLLFSTIVIIYLVFAIFASNYRTTILAVLPMIAAYFVVRGLTLIRPAHHMALVFGVALTGVVATILLFPLLPPRYMELVNVVVEVDRYIQPSEEFTFDERRLLSSRLILWTKYIEAYVDGNILQYFFGFGPFAYEDKFPLSAHSSYVSYLYEYGALGLAVFLTLLAINTVIALFIPDLGTKVRIVSLHLGFMLLNMTTVAMKSIEGVVVYAMILAITFVSLRRVRRTAA